MSLPTYAEKFAAMLSAVFPELGLSAPPDRYELEQRRCFSFQVPCPSAAVSTPLSVAVTEKEVTVEWLGASVHFTNPQEAVVQIQALFEESAVVDTWYSGPYPKDRAFVSPRHSPNAPLGMRGVTRIERRSWKGTHDLNEKVT